MKKYIKIIIGLLLLLSIIGQKNFGFTNLVNSSDYDMGVSIGKNVGTLMLYVVSFWLLLTAFKKESKEEPDSLKETHKE